MIKQVNIPVCTSADAPILGRRLSRSHTPHNTHTTPTGGPVIWPQDPKTSHGLGRTQLADLRALGRTHGPKTGRTPVFKGLGAHRYAELWVIFQIVTLSWKQVLPARIFSKSQDWLSNFLGLSLIFQGCLRLIARHISLDLYQYNANITATTVFAPTQLFLSPYFEDQIQGQKSWLCRLWMNEWMNELYSRHVVHIQSNLNESYSGSATILVLLLSADVISGRYPILRSVKNLDWKLFSWLAYTAK